MVRIPRIQPQARTITGATPGRTIQRAGVAGELTQIAGRTLEEVGEQLRRTNLIAEKTRAQNELDSRLRDIQTQAESDGDISPKRQKFYDREIQKAQSDASNLINIPAEKSLFQLQSQSKAGIARTRVKGFFNKKVGDQAVVDADIYLENKEREFISTINFKEKQTAVLERDAKLEELVDAGHISPADFTKTVDGLNKKWAKSQLDFDIDADPDLAAKNITAGNYKLTAKEQNTALTLANNLKKKRKAEDNRAKEAATQQNEIDLYNGVVDGSKSLIDINNAEARGRIGLSDGIREEVAADLRRLVTEENTATPLQQANSFVELQDRFTDLDLTEDSPETILKFKSDVISALAKGSLRSPAVGEKWLKEVSGELKEKGEGWNIIKLFTSALSQNLKVFSPNDIKIAEERLGTELLERTDKGEDDTKAAEEIVQEEQKRINPRLNVKSEKGKKFIDKNGRKILMFPDGTFQRIE